MLRRKALKGPGRERGARPTVRRPQAEEGGQVERSACVRRVGRGLDRKQPDGRSALRFGEVVRLLPDEGGEPGAANAARGARRGGGGGG